MRGRPRLAAGRARLIPQKMTGTLSARMEFAGLDLTRCSLGFGAQER